MVDILIKQIDSMYVILHGEQAILYEINDKFSFFADNYKFMPKFKARIWDGKIRLFDIRSGKFYLGLVPKLVKWLTNNGYSFTIDVYDTKGSIDIDEILKFNNTKIVPHEHQLQTVKYVLENKKCLIESATSSGKSFSIYLLCKYLNASDKKVLVITPRVALVNQLTDDLHEYDPSTKIHQIYSGQEKYVDVPIVISTYHSLQELPESFFEEFSAIIVDEVHEFEHKSAQGILNKALNIEYRVGLTGTLKDTKTGKLQLNGLFGDVFTAIKTKELISKKLAASININSIRLKYSNFKQPKADQNNGKAVYDYELSTIFNHEKRNKFIIKLANSKEGNVVIFYRFIDKHGLKLFNLAKEICKDKKVFFINKDTKNSERQHIREYCEKNDDAILIASMGVFAVGVSIKNLIHGIFAHPMKGNIKIIQSIGRLLRLNKKDKVATLYDIGDMLSESSILYKSFIERQKIYKKEGHSTKVIELDIC